MCVCVCVCTMFSSDVFYGITWTDFPVSNMQFAMCQNKPWQLGKGFFLKDALAVPKLCLTA